jgi:D-glycero-D-manno-heptose 1,7-bisphosphate phosphatase
MLDVGGRPFLDYLLDELGRYRTLERVLLLSAHLGGQVVARYHGTHWRSAAVSVVQEPEPLGTGGALFNARAMLDREFLLLNGDSFFDFNIMDLAARPMSSSTLARMALKREQAGDRYGRLDIEGNRVRRFLPPSAATRGAINAGIYVARREIVDRIAATPCSLEQVVLPELAEHGMLEAHPYDGYFIDIGVPGDFERAQEELPRRLRRPAVFLDRDGVLNRDAGYVHRVENFQWVEGAREAVKLCNDRGYLVFVVSNQAGVARGYYDIDAVECLHAWMDERFAEAGAHVDEYRYCPYHEEGTVVEFRRQSDWRKPAPGMLLDCLRSWPVDEEHSFLIGDRLSDIEAARRAGLPGHLFTGGNLANLVARCMAER